MATLLISKADEMRISQRYTLNPPKDFIFSDRFVDTSTISRDRLKTETVSLKTYEIGEGSKYTNEGGYKGGAGKIGYTKYTYDFEYGFKDEVPGGELGNAGLTTKEFAESIRETHKANYNEKMTRKVIDAVSKGAGNKVNIASNALTAKSLFDAIKAGIDKLSSVDPNKLSDWAVDDTDIELWLSREANNILLSSYESKAVIDVQGSVTIKNGKFVDFYGMDTKVIDTGLFVDGYDWKDVEVNGVTDKFYRVKEGASPILFALVAKNKPNRPVLIVDNLRVHLKHQESAVRDSYENVGHIIAGAQVIEPNKKGVYVCIKADTLPAVEEVVQKVDTPVQEKTSGVL